MSQNNKHLKKFILHNDLKSSEKENSDSTTKIQLKMPTKMPHYQHLHLAKNDRRYLKRIETIQDEMNVLAQFGEIELKGYIVNYNTTGFLIKSEYRIDFPPLAIIDNVKILYKNKLIGDYKKLQFIREDSPLHYAFSVMISDENKIPQTTNTTRTNQREYDRYQVNSKFVIDIECYHPYRYDYNLYFKVLDISLAGAKISTSLSNHSLLVGTEMKHIIFNFPTIGSIDILGKIVSVTPKNDELILGLTYTTTNEQERKKLEEYLSAYIIKFCHFSPIIGTKSPLTYLKENNLLGSSIKNKVNFGYVTNEEEYLEVLRIREQTYGKYYPELTAEDFADIYDTHSRILTAKIKDQIVGSVRITYSQNDDQQFELDASIPLPPFIDRRKTLEFSRLCILPELQGSDLVIGFFERIIVEAVTLDAEHIITSSVDKLLPRYLNMGFKKGFQFEIKTIDNAKSTFLYLKVDNIYSGKKVNPYLWKLFFERPLNYLYRFGYKKPGISLTKSIFANIIKHYLEFKKKKKTKQIEQKSHDQNNH